MPIVFSRSAQADLRGIGDYIAADDPARAARFIADLRARCLALGRRPMMGRPAPEIAPGVRILVFRPYLVLYRVRDDRVLIDRVIHSARDRSALPPYE